MNAEMNEGLNEDYRVGAPVFDDEGSFDVDHEVETVESHDDVTSQEPVAEPVEQPSETVPIDRQRSEEQFKKSREALTKFYEQQPKAPMVEDEGSPPDPREDPVRLVSWMLDRIKKQDEYIREQKEAIRQAEEQHQHDMHLSQFFNSSFENVKDKYRDFDAAANFLYEARAKELSSWSSLYPEYGQKSTIDAIIKDQLHALVATCAQRDLNPAEEIYRIAQNLGYQNQAVQANDQIAALQSRQNSARTLTASGGGGSVGPMTLKDIDNMTQEEFDVWISKPKNKEIFRRLHGAGNGY